ncbi:MAG: alanine:cation symporter family protein [Eubacteriales bacterium]
MTKHTEDRSISQFQSLCTALAATVGTGNIVGVAGAIEGRRGILDVAHRLLWHDDQLFRKCAGYPVPPQKQ